MQCLGSKSKDLIGFSFIMLKLKKKSLLYFEKTKNSQEKERKKEGSERNENLFGT